MYLPRRHIERFSAAVSQNKLDMAAFNSPDEIIARKPFHGLDQQAFRKMLYKRAFDNTIVLISVDSGYLDMAVNFYLTSLNKFEINNYLFVGSDPYVCAELSRHNITCYQYTRDPDAGQASVYSSVAFKRKTHLKTKIVLEAMMNGLNVILSDVDIVFFKNPLPLFTCHTCDLEISSDIIEAKSGFHFARPTLASLKLHKNAWNYGRAKSDVSNQKALNMYLKKMEKNNEIKIKYLDPKTYVNGKEYFDDGGSTFSGNNPCLQCVLVHNNWIYTLAAKIYRFKESGLWQYDKDNYFSNASNRYLSFDLHSRYHGNSTSSSELVALKNALILGAMLDRIVILPKFHRCRCGCFSSCKKPPMKCSLGNILNMEVFDSHLNGRYRESAFLRHEKVPSVIKQSLECCQTFHDMPEIHVGLQLERYWHGSNIVQSRYLGSILYMMSCFSMRTRRTMKEF